MRTGSKVKYLGEYWGMDAIDGVRFIGSVHAGDTGTFISKHQNKKLKDWLWTKSDTAPALYVPVHPNHIEVLL